MRSLYRYVPLLLYAIPVQAQWVEQSFELRPGINSVFLWVDPTENRADALFDGSIIKGVWQRDSAVSSASACGEEDVGCVPTSDAAWLAWRPEGHPARFANTLRVIQGGHVYLIEAADSARITISGKPCSTQTKWKPGPNLAGAFVSPKAPPPFATYFEPSDAHNDSSVYQLDRSGRWQKVDPKHTFIDGNTGYWITASKATAYSGPVEVDDPTLRGIDFARTLSEHALALRTHSNTDSVTLRYLSPSATSEQWAGDVPLTIREFVENDDGAAFVWNPVDDYEVSLTRTLRTLRLGVDRAGLAEAIMTPDGAGRVYRGLLEITDHHGFRRLVSVEAQMPGDEGLWVGTVTVDKVAWVHADLMGDPDPVSPRPTVSPFTFRVIMHVDSADQVKLLSEVMLLWDEQADTYVLVTPGVSATYVAQLKPTGNDDFTRRISTANYHIGADVGGALTQEMGGTFGVVDGDVSFVLTTPADDPHNPFKHAYHPDHDCVDNASGNPIPDCDAVGESYEITRTPLFTFKEQQADTWVGDYTESITGLNKTSVAIKVSGTFELTRVSQIASLNNGM